VFPTDRVVTTPGQVVYELSPIARQDKGELLLRRELGVLVPIVAEGPITAARSGAPPLKGREWGMGATLSELAAAAQSALPWAGWAVVPTPVANARSPIYRRFAKAFTTRGLFAGRASGPHTSHPCESYLGMKGLAETALAARTDGRRSTGTIKFTMPPL